MTPLEQRLEQEGCGNKKNPEDAQYACKSSYMGATISTLFKLDEKEIALALDNAKKYSHEGNKQKIQEIYSLYGTPQCAGSSCIVPLFNDQLIKMKKIPGYIFPDIWAESEYKWMQSEKEKHDIGDERAMAEWADSPMNPNFAKQYVKKKENGKQHWYQLPQKLLLTFFGFRRDGLQKDRAQIRH